MKIGDENIQEQTISHDLKTNTNIANNDKDNQFGEKNKQIKILVNLYLLDLEIKTRITTTCDDNNYFISECYLINKTWIKKYKDFYNYDKIIADFTKAKGIEKILKERIGKNKETFEKLCLTMSNYSTRKLKNTYNLPEEKYEEQLILVENKQISNDIINENSKITYPVLFEIINEQIYELLFKENKLNNNSLILQKYKLIINEGKIIITTMEESNYLLIISVNNDSYENEYLIYLINNKNTNEYFDYLKKNPLSKCLKKFFPGLNYILSYNEKEGKFKIYGKFINLKNQINNEYQISLNDINKINNDIDFIIKLYFYYDEFNYRLNQKLSKNFQIKKYALVNTNLLEIYKNFYNYSEIKEIIKNNNTIQNIINKYKNDKSYIDYNNIELINEIKKKLPIKIIDDILNKNKGEYFKEFSNTNIDKINIIPKKLADNYPEISYYDNFFLIDVELAKLLSQNKEFHLIDCVIGEEKLFLKIEEKNKIFINIAEFNKDSRLCECELVINCQKENINSTMKDIFINGYKQYASSLKFNEKNIASIDNIFAYKIKDRPYFKTIINNDKEKNINNINKSKIIIENSNNMFIDNKELQNLILIFIDNVIIKQTIKEKMNNVKEEYYLVNSEWLINYMNKYNLVDIYNYMNNEVNINDKVIRLIFYKNINIEKKLEIFLSWLDKKEINQKSRKNNEINYKNLSFFALQKRVSVNKKGEIIKKIYCYNNFILLSKYTLNKLVKDYSIIINDIEDDIKIILGENKIFLKTKKSLQVGKLTNDDYIFNLKFIFYFYNNSELEKSVDFMIENGFDKFCNYNLIFNNIYNFTDGDIFSPIFNKEYQIIGNCFKYHENINDFTKYQINKMLRTMIKLYLNYLHLNQYFNSKNLNKEKFYLISKKQISKIKIDYNYEQIKNELSNKNPIIKQYLDNSNKEKNLLNEKMITRIIKYMDPKFNTNFNENEEKNIKEKHENENENEYENENEKEPQIEVYMFFNELNKEELLMYYSNFELLNNQLKENNNNKKNKENNFVNCYFIDDIILVNCSNININSNKMIFEVGSLDNDNTFILSHFIIFNNSFNLEKNIEYLCGNGIKNLFIKMDSNSYEKNKMTLYNKEGSIIGVIIKVHFQNSVNNQSKSSLNIINNYNISNNYSSINNYNNQNSINFNYDINSNINFNNFPPFDISYNNESNYNIFNNEESESQDLLVIYYDNVISENSKIKSIKDYFKISPPKIGLKNLDYANYINATLQCFCQIEKLVNYFKYSRQVVDTIQENIFFNENNIINKKNILTSSFKYLIEHLWPTIYEINEKFALNQNENKNNISYAPYEFKKKISKMRTLFSETQTNDIKNLINFILTNLHQELNTINLNNNINQTNSNIDNTNQQMMFQNFIQKFVMENRSIISDLFYAMNGSTKTCTNCGIDKYNYQTYFFISFPLEEVKKFVINNYQMMNNNNSMIQFQQSYYNIQNINSITIYDCFNYYQNPILMDGQNSIYCNYCHNIFPFWNKNFITTVPEILIIVLNRENQFGIKFEFYENLNLQNYIQMQDTGFIYNLIGVVSHMGLSGASGRFVAFCKNPIDGNWYNYNDDLVDPVFNFKDQVIDYSIPYILFYQKVQ